MDIQALTLADERATVCSKVDNLLLADLPDGLVDSLDVVWDSWNLLNRSTMSDNHVFHLIVPQFEVNKLAKEPGADDLELSCENSASIDVALGGQTVALGRRSLLT